MKIEEEVHQRSFQSEYQRAHINIVFTAAWLQSRLTQRFKVYNLTLPQFNILRILRGQQPRPATIQLLMQRMLDKTSNASRIVDKLESKGLVTRTINPVDRRQVDVMITEAGLALLHRIDLADDLHHLGIENLSPDEARLLNDFLDRIRE